MLYDCRTVAERDRGIAAAVEAVKSGELAVFPTDHRLRRRRRTRSPAHAVNALQNARGSDRRVPPVSGRLAAHPRRPGLLPA
jgi:hypothetical protein